METEFKLFDPKISTMDELPDEPGNYFIVLRANCQLPSIDITPIYHKWNYENVEYNIIYTGISNQSLRVRDYKQHFTGNNAGRSTLRKSLGSMMGFLKIPRDKNNPTNGKTKFSMQDEEKLSAWMKDNLLLFYKPCNSKDEIERNEKKFIYDYNPPLNLQGNENEENKKFREKIKMLRR